MALDTAKATVVLRDITKRFDAGVRNATPFYPNLSTIVDSDGADEKYGLLGNVPAIREWLGERKAKELRAANYVVTNRDWEGTLRIPKNDIDDDRTKMYGPLGEQLGRRAAHHPDKLLFEKIVAGESTACFDGQFFFDTDHSWGDSGTQSNDLTATAATGTTPTAAEFKTAFDAAVAALLGFKDDQGEPIVIPVAGELSDLVVIVPVALRQQAYEGLTAQLVGGGNTNVVVDMPTIRVSPYLTDATKMYVFYMGDVLRPFIFQDREPISRAVEGLDSIKEKDIWFMTKSRYELGYLAWWNAVLTTFT